MLRHERRLCRRSILAVCTCKLESSIEVYLHWYHSAFRLLIITLFVRKSRSTLSLVNLSLTVTLSRLSSHSLARQLVAHPLARQLVAHPLARHKHLDTHVQGHVFLDTPFETRNDGVAQDKDRAKEVWHKTKTEQKTSRFREVSGQDKTETAQIDNPSPSQVTLPLPQRDTPFPTKRHSLSVN